MAVDAVADCLLQKEPLFLAKRMGFCDCGRLVLDDDDLTRRSLSSVAAVNMTACQALVLAAIDYAHRTFGCAGLSALIHELTEDHRAPLEPPVLTALLDRVHAAHRAEHGHAGHRRVSDAVMWPHTAAFSMPELVPHP